MNAMTCLSLPAEARATHCAELLGAGPTMDELAPALSLLGEKLARVLPAGLARLSGGEPPLVRAALPVGCTLASLLEEAGTLAAHALLGLGTARLPLLATFAAEPVLRLVDRAFGGRGVVPRPLPERFPLSAELLIGRIEQAVADALTAAFGDGEARPLRRDTSLRQLDPFAPGEALLRLSLEIVEEGAEPWSLSLVFPQATLVAAFAGQRRPARAGTRAAPDPAGEPFASMPLDVTAVLVDMTIGFSRLSALKPGDVLPVAVARSVPLQVDGRTIATGTVGEIEDRVAVQILQAF